MTERLRALQALRLKGRAPAPDIAASAGITEAALDPLLTELISAGYIEQARGRLKLTDAGRDHLASLLAEERKQVDQGALVDVYGEFDTHNSALKALMTRWQLRDDGTPNDHSDAGYDAAVIDELYALDERFRPLLDRFVTLAPRLGHYPARFAAALERIQRGDHSWFARPTVDSYHTVWFELHEELIGLAGLSRAQEAAQGRAE